MAGPNVDISVRIEVLNSQRQFLGGTVDIVLTPQAPGQTVNVTAADASKDIDVGGLVRSALYQVTVTPVNAPKPAPQSVDIPPTRFTTVQFIVDVPIVGPGQYTLKGNLVFDYGLPAAGITVRLYSVGFGGRDVMLGAVQSDAQGNYSIAYSLAPGFLPNIQVRVLDPTGKEVTISNTKFNAQPSETLNLVRREDRPSVQGVRVLARRISRLAALCIAVT